MHSNDTGAARVSIDDLALAATWLDYYDGSGENGDVENEARARRAAAWIRAEIDRRVEDARVRNLAKRTGATRAHARRVLRKVIAESRAGR